MNLRESLLKTIVFFDLFRFPLTAEEIGGRLYRYDKPVHIKEIKGTLAQLAEGGILETLKDYHVLAGRAELPETRKARRFIAEKWWNRVKFYSHYLHFLPFTRMIAVCNNLAYDNADEQSDIDLFIVAETGHLWTARFFATVLLHFFGVRRHGGKVAGRFCLSFFVTADAMDMEPLQIQPEDPYLAFWTQALAPVYGEKTYDAFVRQNAGWLARDYGLAFLPEAKRHLSPAKEGRMKRIFEWFFGDWFEALLKKTLKPKTLAAQARLGPLADVVVKDTMLKFHNHDRRREYLERWQKRLEQQALHFHKKVLL